MRALDVALVGCGHMGRHHARTVARHPGCRLVAAIDIVPERARAVAAQWGAEARSDVPAGVDAVVVATPTTSHAALASRNLADGRWCLVEKPLAATVAEATTLGVDRLVVGHTERFNPALRGLGDVRPRFLETRRQAPPTARSQDVDVVLDLMLHDLDLVLEWSSGEVAWLDAVGVRVHGDHIDAASARIRTTDGVTASLFASRVAAETERTIRIFAHGQYVGLDLLRGCKVGGDPLPSDGRDALTAQWDAFVDAVLGRGPIRVDATAARRALALAARISDTIGG